MPRPEGSHVSVEVVTKKYTTLRAYLLASGGRYELASLDLLVSYAGQMGPFIDRFKGVAAELKLPFHLGDGVEASVAECVAELRERRE